jgi:mitotic-spindle organizing protein 1
MKQADWQNRGLFEAMRVVADSHPRVRGLARYRWVICLVYRVSCPFKFSMDGDRTKLLDSLQELSNILETGLDRESLSILMELTESGVNPEALAALVKELRKQRSIDESEVPSFFKT